MRKCEAKITSRRVYKGQRFEQWDEREHERYDTCQRYSKDESQLYCWMHRTPNVILNTLRPQGLPQQPQKYHHHENDICKEHNKGDEE
jgi:hypothetical protein